jgi:hypothetical protein
LNVIHDRSFHNPNLGRSRSTPRPVFSETPVTNWWALAEVG